MPASVVSIAKVTSSAELLDVMLRPPNSFNLSEPNATVLSAASSDWITNDVAIETSEAAVTRPFALTVNTGISVVEPNSPTLPLTVANVAAPVTLPEPSNDADVYATSPVVAIVTPAANAVAVSELPVTLPVKLPAKFVLAVITVPPIVPNATLSDVPTACPIATAPEVIVTPVPPVK